jgi:hypothetical protein
LPHTQLPRHHTYQINQYYMYFQTFMITWLPACRVNGVEIKLYRKNFAFRFLVLHFMIQPFVTVYIRPRKDICTEGPILLGKRKLLPLKAAHKHLQATGPAELLLTVSAHHVAAPALPLPRGLRGHNSSASPAWVTWQAGHRFAVTEILYSPNLLMKVLYACRSDREAVKSPLVSSLCRAPSE